MAYEPFADEGTIREMCEAWSVEYQTMCRIIRQRGMRPTRRHYATQFFNREQQAQLARDVAAYMLYPRYLEMPDQPDHPEAREFNLSHHMELVERARVAEGRVKRLMAHVTADQDEITRLRAERTALQADNDQLHVHLRNLISPDGDDDGLLARLVSLCAHLCDMDEAGYTHFQHDLVDDANAVLVLSGTLRLLGAALDASIRQNDARLLSPTDTMTVTRALATLVDVGKIADARLDQYDALAQAILAEEEVHP